MTKEIIINETLGVSKESILNREHNLWIGISLSNKFFTPSNIKSLIEFALEYTKDKILILVPGRMQATNYMYFDDFGRAEAPRKAFEDEDRVILEIGEILKELPKNKIENIVITNYDSICTSKHIAQREVLYREFSQQKDFYGAVIDVVKEAILRRGRTYRKDRAESLALYVLSELPLFIDGVQKNGESTVYTVMPYPGLGKLDELVMKIRNDDNFKFLRDQLSIKNTTGVIGIE